MYWLLQKALKLEYSDIFLYPRHAPNLVKNPWHIQLFNYFGQSETRHADILSAEITKLGGISAWDFNILQGKKQPKDIIKYHLSAEHQAIKLYKQCLKLITEPRLKKLITNILQDETIHESTLLKIKDQI